MTETISALTMSTPALMLRSVDGDIFGAVSRLGRNAAEGVVRALSGELLDPFLASRCIDVLITAAGGIPSLPAVLEVIRSVNALPLLASTLVESSVERVGDAVRDANGTVLDLMLRSVVQRSLLVREHEPRQMLQKFFMELLDRAIISGRGGFVEVDGGSARRSEALAVLEPVAAAAAARLEARPDAKLLGLARQHAQLKPDSNLLGAPDDHQ